MNVKRSVIRGSVSLGGARAVISILNAAGIIVLARLLTPDDFGIVAISTAMLGVIMAATEASLQPALVQCRSPTQDHVDTVWTMSLIRAAIIFAIFAIGAWPLSVIYDDPRLVGVLVVTGLTGAFMEFYNPRITLAARNMEFRAVAAFWISQKLSGLALSIILAVIFRSYWAIIIGNAAGTLLASLYSYAMVPYRPRFTLSRAGEIWGFSRWMFLTQLCETLNWRFDQLVIGLIATKAQLGFYSVADNLAAIPSRELSMPIRSALFAGLASLAGQSERLRSSFLRAQSAIAMLTVPAAAGVALVADPTVRLLLGEDWIATTTFVQILAITYAFDMFVVAVRPLGMATGDTRLLFMRQLAGLLVRVPLILIGLAAGGMIGAALGRGLGGAINCLISFHVAEQLVGLSMREQMKGHAATVAGVTAMSGLVLFLQFELEAVLAPFPVIAILVLGSAGALTYCGTILLIWLASGRQYGVVGEIVGTAATLPAFRIITRMSRS